jgi:hypothetical protein
MYSCICKQRIFSATGLADQHPGPRSIAELKQIHLFFICYLPSNLAPSSRVWTGRSWAVYKGGGMQKIKLLLPSAWLTDRSDKKAEVATL